MLPVVYNGALAFLGTDHFRLGLRDGSPLSFDKCGWLNELLTTNQDFHKMMFGVKTVSTYTVASFFFQRVASKILVFQKDKENTMECVLAKNENGQHTYMAIRCWSRF